MEGAKTEKKRGKDEWRAQEGEERGLRGEREREGELDSFIFQGLSV